MINVPPLRERREDIPALVSYFIEKLAAVHGKVVRGVDPSAMQRLVDMPWPGNVRQLQNFVEQAVILAEGEILTEHEFAANHAPSGASAPSGVAAYEPGLPLCEVERRHILNTLRAVGGNRTEAARRLGISIRGLQYKLKEYAERDARQ